MLIVTIALKTLKVINMNNNMNISLGDKLMNISEIRTSGVANYEPFAPAKIDAKKVADNNEKVTLANEKTNETWQKNILLDALDSIESSLVKDNSHPLDLAANAPIESFDEALIELNFIKTPLFKKYASQAQANIRAEDVVALFADESF